MLNLRHFVLCASVTGLCAAMVMPHSYASEDYARLLSRVVQEDGVGWERLGAKERGWLDSYLKEVAAASPESGLAFWINAHNACVFNLLLDRMPVDDVMSIDGFRDQLTCKVAGRERTLNDIHSGVIRPRFQEPRALFALWWGVRGGPRLRARPYASSDLEAALSEQTRLTLERPGVVRFEGKPERMTLSPLLDWFKFDFGTSETALLAFLKSNLSKERASKVPAKFADLSFDPFDWSLDGGQVRVP